MLHGVRARFVHNALGEKGLVSSGFLPYMVHLSGPDGELRSDFAQSCNASTRDLIWWSSERPDDHNGRGQQAIEPPTAEENVMNPRTAKKVFGTIIAAVTLTMVTSVAPASAADNAKVRGGGVQIAQRDTGWDIP
jgi:hypothetical protein